VPEVRMTVEEYLALLQTENTRTQPKMTKTSRVKPVGKRKGKKDPKMAKALRQANKIGRTKAGKLRKGYTQARIMKKAHQLRRKM
jgi:hypothetical protein